MTVFPTNKMELLRKGVRLIRDFCKLNKIPVPSVQIVLARQWHWNACAYYDEQSICICLERCQHPCGDARGSNWTWPGSSVDREPYGVVAHELGHHVDRYTGERKGRYSSEYSGHVRDKSEEPPLTGYCPNDSEWFAEMFRLFVTNPELLKKLRPATHRVLTSKWKPVVMTDWQEAMGTNVPQRVVVAQISKIRKANSYLR